MSSRSPTPRQRKAAEAYVENMQSEQPASTKAVLESVGYGAALQDQPKRVVESDGFQEVLKQLLPDGLIVKRHEELLNSTRLDHMTFPLGPKNAAELAKLEAEAEAQFQEETEVGEVDVELEGQSHGGALLRRHKKKEIGKLTDEEIVEMLAEVNCTVRKIVHGEGARHVYFWSADNRARKDALDMAYKLKGQYKVEQAVAKPASVNTYNFIFSPETQESVRAIEEKLKARLIESNVPKD